MLKNKMIIILIIIGLLLFFINVNKLSNLDDINQNDEIENSIYEDGIQEENDDEKNMDNVFIEMKDNSLTSTGLVLTIENKGDNIYLFTETYEIEKKENGEWTNYFYITQKKAEPDIYIEKDAVKDVNVKWENESEGGLPKGEYRLKILGKFNYPSENVYYYITFVIE